MALPVLIIDFQAKCDVVVFVVVVDVVVVVVDVVVVVVDVVVMRG